MLGRSILSLRGSQCVKLLQSLCTNDVVSWSQQEPMYAAFLTTKGRILADAFLYGGRHETEILLDVATGQKASLLKHIKTYKLRSDVTLKDETDLRVSTLDDGRVVSGGNDPRASKLGQRFVVIQGDEPQEEEEDRRRRLALGIGQGMELSNRIPLECNLDALAAVSFNKGCYLGQELTARAKHRGTVRKRLVPLMVGKKVDSLQVVDQATAIAWDGPIVTGSVTSTSGHALGEVVASEPGIALAMLRLNALDDATSTCQVAGLTVSPFLPEWWQDVGLANAIVSTAI